MSHAPSLALVPSPAARKQQRQLLIVTALVLIAHAAMIVGLPRWSLTPTRPSRVDIAPLVAHVVTIPQSQQAAATPPSTPPAPPPPTAELPDAPVPRPTRPKLRRQQPPQKAEQAATAPIMAQMAEDAAPQQAVDDGPSVLSSVDSARAGGSAGPAPIDRILSSDEANALREMVHGARPTPTRIPPAVELVYSVTGSQPQASSTLLWRHDGETYDAHWSFGYRSRGKGVHEWRSQGLLTPNGLLPVGARDARQDTAIRTVFDYARQTAFFDTGPAEHTSAQFESTGQAHLPQQAQDPLSAVIQLSALVAAAPDKYPVGGSLTLPVVTAEGASDWLFSIEGEEQLTVRNNRVVNTLRIVHRAATDGDAQLEVWLGPRLSYLPAQIRLKTSEGNVEVHTLRWGYETLVLPPRMDPGRDSPTS